MSHFVVTVCLPDEQVSEYGVETAVAAALSPFDENERVTPYRSYEDGGPDNFWWVESVRSDRDDMLAGTGIRPYDPTKIGWSSHGGINVPEDVQRANQATAAAYADQLGERPTWELVAKLYNEAYAPNTALAIPGEEVEDEEIDRERLHYDEETGRAYKWTTYNPESQWDWWIIGGRWQRRLISRPNVNINDLVLGRAGTFGDNQRPNFDAEGRIFCDGAQLKNLDLEFMRAEGAREHLVYYDQWWKLVEQYGVPTSWSSLVGQVEAGEISVEEARKRYHSQDIINAAQKLFNDPFINFEETYGMSREDFIQKARNNAFVGYAVLTPKGEWTAPGRMGMWGISSDSENEHSSFKIMANQYIDTLPEDTWIISVDCHI